MKKRIAFIMLCIVALAAKADEGMWMVGNLSEKTQKVLKEMGLELTPEQIYNPNGPSLNNAIVMFGGFCSGVVVSNEGLVFTNHHCGFDAIQDHSTVKKDYLKNGFLAKRLKDELPNPELYVAFHLSTVDVTDKILAGVKPGMDEMAKALYMDSVATSLEEAVLDTVNCIYGEITPYYKGSKYYLSVYQRFDDVRLVFAPPQSLGKFGGDTDNWMWPRQTCDFSVFRIYANKNNKPAEYSEDNVPYHPVSYAHVSTQGYQPGSFCMTFGYPGSTDRYLSSYGIENTMRTSNDLRYQVRGVKLAILDEAMKREDAIRIMYASKYAASSNYWKFSLGQNKALKELKVIEEKQALENEIKEWAAQNRKTQYIGILDSLKYLYSKSFPGEYTLTLLEESFYSGSDIMQFAMKSMIRYMRPDAKNDGFKDDVRKTYRDIDIELDKKVFAAMIKNYKQQVLSKDYLPDFYDEIDEKFGGNIDAYTDDLFANSVLTDLEKVNKLESSEELHQDPIYYMAVSVLTKLYQCYQSNSISEFERLLGNALREMNHEKEYYPDANFTMRMSFGIVEGYSPSADLNYVHYTLPQSLIDKNEQNPDNYDYQLIPSVYKWLKKGKFGDRYIDKSLGQMPLCFLTNNDITGGNSGSGMFDGKGRLIGLAFDGNWEAMSSDLKFDSKLQRCIGVDIRYVLSVIEKYGKGKRLINELTLED
ncbi:MAG: S46 family peptidase [Bacteroidaceae bacterium]|nr:S46 family peptidase [Bacteroidaceae bacterium]